ncbi:hypothetical protein SEPCBS57363_002039 [Sporothrix epigloea]|uniref:Uncharacterized protein n=1 Tax=Sporothrix epigloea TaxID=1892477 RepID=A0ABP0DDM2_9PEZI
MSRRPPRELQASAGSSKPRSSNRKAISTGSDTDNDTDSSQNSISSSSPSLPPALPPQAPDRARPRRRARARPLSETTAIPRQSLASAHSSNLPPLDETPLALPPPPIGGASAGRSLSPSLSPRPNGRQSNPRPSYNTQSSPVSSPLSEAHDALPSRDSRRQRQRAELPLRSDALPRSFQVPRLDDQSAVVVRQSSQRPPDHAEYDDEKYSGQDRRDPLYQRDQRERRDFREHRGHREHQDQQDYREEANNDLASLSSSAWKAPLLFVGSVAAATFCIDRFWPKGITYGEKEAWEVREEVFHRHHDRDGRQRIDHEAETTRTMPDGSRRIVERERIDERRLDDRRIRDRKRVQDRAEEVANEHRPRGSTQRREKAVIVDKQDDSQYEKQYNDRSPVPRDSLRMPTTARASRPSRLTEGAAFREDALNPQYSRYTRGIQDDASDGEESFRRLRERRARARDGPPSRSAWDARTMQGAAVITAADEDDRLRRRRQNGADGSMYEHNSRDLQVDRRDRAPRDAYGEDDLRRSLYSHAHGNGRFLLDTSNADADHYSSSRGWPRKKSVASDRDPETEGRLPVDRTQRQHAQRQRRDYADADGDYRELGSSRRTDGRSAATAAAAATAAVAAGATFAAINGREDRRERQDRPQGYRYDEDRSFSPSPRPNRFSTAYTIDGPLRQPEPVSYAQSANDGPVSKGPKVSRGSYRKPLDDYDSEPDAPSTFFSPPSQVTSLGGGQSPIDDHSDDDDDLIEVIEESAPTRRASRRNQSSSLSPQPPPPVITRSSPPTAEARAPIPVLLSDSDNSDGAGHTRRRPRKGRDGLPPQTPLPLKSNSVVSVADVTTDDEARNYRNEVLTDSDSLAYTDSEVSDQPSARRSSEKSLHVYPETPAPKTNLRRGHEPESVYMTGGAGPAPSNHSETSDSSSRGTAPPPDRRSRRRPTVEKCSDSEDSDSEARYSRSPRRARADSETSKVDKSLILDPNDLDQQSDWDRDGVRSTQSMQSLDSTGSDSHRRAAPYTVPSPPPIESEAGGKRKSSVSSSDNSGRSPSPPSRVTRSAAVAGASYLSEDMSRPSDTSSLRDRYQSGNGSRGPASSFVSDSLQSVSLRSNAFRSRGSLHRKSSGSGDDSSSRSSSRSCGPSRLPHHRSPQAPRSSTSTRLMSKGGSDSEPDAQSSWGHSAIDSVGYAGRSEASRRSCQGTTQSHDYFSYKSHRHKSRASSDSGAESKKSSSESDNDSRSQRTGNAGSVSASDKRSRASVHESASDSDSDRNTIRHSTTSSHSTRSRPEAATEVRVRARQIAIDREQAQEARAKKDRQRDWDSLRMHDKAAI